MKKPAGFLVGGMVLLFITLAVHDGRFLVAEAQGNRPSAPVHIVNTPLPVTLAVTNVEEPFQASLCTASGAISCGDLVNTLSVPPTHRMSIAMVTSECELGSTGDTLLGFTVRTTVGTESVRHRFNATPVWPPVATSNRYVQAHQTRMYADPGTNVTVETFVFGLGSRRCFVTLSGGLAPVE